MTRTRALGLLLFSPMFPRRFNRLVTRDNGETVLLVFFAGWVLWTGFQLWMRGQ